MKRITKQYVSILLILLIAICLVGCGKKSENQINAESKELFNKIIPGGNSEENLSFFSQGKTPEEAKEKAIELIKQWQKSCFNGYSYTYIDSEENNTFIIVFRPIEENDYASYLEDMAKTAAKSCYKEMKDIFDGTGIITTYGLIDYDENVKWMFTEQDLQ